MAFPRGFTVAGMAARVGLAGLMAGALGVCPAVALAAGHPHPDPGGRARLMAADAGPDASFGYSVAVSGATAVVGAYGEHSSMGAAYVFTRTGTRWSQQAELTAADGKAGDYFGREVAVSGSTIVVGADVKNSSTGAVYVFARTGTHWTQQAELTASDAAKGDSFGLSLAIAGSTVVVAAPGKDFATGAAYVFVRTGTHWTQQAKLTAADGVSGDNFGVSVAVSGSTVLVGVDVKHSTRGVVYVFQRSGRRWGQRAELTASDAAPGDYFGRAVAVAGSAIVVGADGDNSFAGAAYVFGRSGRRWYQRAELTASDAAAGGLFGVSVGLSGSTVIVGAFGENAGRGAAYVFTRRGQRWSQQAELTAPDIPADESFGYAVAISGSTAVAGAIGGSRSGAAYVFTRA